GSKKSGSIFTASEPSVMCKGRIVLTKSDWKTEPFPIKKDDLGYEGFFCDEDAEKIMSGHKPEDMDDKWFIYSEGGWVYFVRSWTGHHIFALQLTGTPTGGVKVIASWVNRNFEQYRSPGKEIDIQIINNLIKSRFGVEGHT
ncbi:hypothetical protein, partial [Enterovibrio norvegicus]|uniref:hypothetical protein n=1 Tax=Enterovibrio norvegicus TaxID=188144 RepID=UPI00352D15D2